MAAEGGDHWNRKRSLPIGAEVFEGGVHFRLWAPACSKAKVILESKTRSSDSKAFPERELISENNGYFSGWIEGIGADSLYRFRLDSEKRLLPDPASRFQPEGPHGPSQVIDPKVFQWHDRAWRGVAIV